MPLEHSYTKTLKLLRDLNKATTKKVPFGELISSALGTVIDAADLRLGMQNVAYTIALLDNLVDMQIAEITQNKQLDAKQQRDQVSQLLKIKEVVAGKILHKYFDDKPSLLSAIDKVGMVELTENLSMGGEVVDNVADLKNESLSSVASANPLLNIKEGVERKKIEKLASQYYQDFNAFVEVVKANHSASHSTAVAPSEKNADAEYESFKSDRKTESIAKDYTINPAKKTENKLSEAAKPKEDDQKNLRNIVRALSTIRDLRSQLVEAKMKVGNFEFIYSPFAKKFLDRLESELKDAQENMPGLVEKMNEETMAALSSIHAPQLSSTDELIPQMDAYKTLMGQKKNSSLESVLTALAEMSVDESENVSMLDIVIARGLRAVKLQKPDVKMSLFNLVVSNQVFDDTDESPTEEEIAEFIALLPDHERVAALTYLNKEGSLKAIGSVYSNYSEYSDYMSDDIKTYLKDAYSLSVIIEVIFKKDVSSSSPDSMTSFFKAELDNMAVTFFKSLLATDKGSAAKALDEFSKHFKALHDLVYDPVPNIEPTQFYLDKVQAMVNSEHTIGSPPNVRELLNKNVGLKVASAFEKMTDVGGVTNRGNLKTAKALPSDKTAQIVDFKLNQARLERGSDLSVFHEKVAGRASEKIDVYSSGNQSYKTLSLYNNFKKTTANAFSTSTPERRISKMESLKEISQALVNLHESLEKYKVAKNDNNFEEVCECLHLLISHTQDHDAVTKSDANKLIPSLLLLIKNNDVIRNITRAAGDKVAPGPDQNIFQQLTASIGNMSNVENSSHSHSSSSFRLKK